MTVGEIGARMSAAELDDWAHFYRLEPWGDWRADFRAGVVAQTVYNMNRAKGAEPLKIEDFMPLIERTAPPPPDPETVRQRLLAAFPPAPRAS